MGSFVTTYLSPSLMVMALAAMNLGETRQTLVFRALEPGFQQWSKRLDLGDGVANIVERCWGDACVAIPKSFNTKFVSSTVDKGCLGCKHEVFWPLFLETLLHAGLTVKDHEVFAIACWVVQHRSSTQLKHGLMHPSRLM